MANLSFVRPLLKEKKIKIKDFCKAIGVTEQGFAKIIRSNSTKIDTLELIAEKLNIPVACFFGDGPSIKPEINVNYINVPFVPVCVQKEYSIECGNKKYIKRLPTIPAAVDNTFIGNYRIFEVKSDSMDDNSIHSLLTGDKILCREVRREFWSSPLQIRDWYFIIVRNTDGITVKQIVTHDVERGSITCHSLNHQFEDLEINLNDVVELYNVISIVDRKIRI